MLHAGPLKAWLVALAAGLALALLACSLPDAGARGPEDGSLGGGLSNAQCRALYGAVLDGGTPDTAGLPAECQAYFGWLLTGDCAALEDRACGAANECAGSGECTAAQLMLEQATSSADCSGALDDQIFFNACQPSTACQSLVAVVCGDRGSETGPCTDSAACTQARMLYLDGNTARCQAALQEPSLFPPCSG